MPDHDPAARRGLRHAFRARRRTRSREPLDPGAQLRVLILSADVGEGHVAAARALHEGLSLRGEVRVVSEDGLHCLGRIARYLIRDGYRAQLGRAPWVYNALYGLWRGVGPLRWVGSRALYRAGRRRLRRLMVRQRPDVVVSTHPALTAALGRMRRRRELDAVLCATITDLTDNPMWCSRGTDLHVVMHPIAVPWVERHAGHGSAVAVRPLVAARFHAPRDVAGARASLDLPEDGSLIVVSGGGWGVGALGDGVDAVLRAGVDTVVVLAGRNDRVRGELEARYRDEARVRVLGFTERMPDLLRGATALVHGTGGVTSLEAVACGCPVIAFGTRLAHVVEHNSAMQRLGLCTIVDDHEHLTRVAAAHIAGLAGPAATISPANPDAAGVVQSAARRVRPLPRWLMSGQQVAVGLACSAGLLWTVATDDAFSLAGGPLHLRPATQLVVHDDAVGVVVSAPARDVAGLAADLGRRHIHVSFGISAPPSLGTLSALRRYGDEAVPVLGGSGAVRWLLTRDQLGDILARAGGHEFIVGRDGLSLGQYLLARSMGARPLAAERVLGTAGAQRPLEPGDIVLARTASGSALLRLIARIGSEGLGVQSLAALTASSSMTAPTAPERPSSPAAAPATSTTPIAETTTPTAL